MILNKRIFILFKSFKLYFLFGILQTPEYYAHSLGKHETVKVLQEYAEVCGSVVMKGCVLNLHFLSHHESVILFHKLKSKLPVKPFSAFWLLFTLTLNAGGCQRA